MQAVKGHDLDFRSLDPVADRAAVAALYEEAADFWTLTNRRAPDRAMTEAFFTDAPPGCDPLASLRQMVLWQGRGVGLLELSFGWPKGGDAYLDLLFLVPRARGLGLGPRILAHVEALARAGRAPGLYLAVLEENSGAMRFWKRMGFEETGVSRWDETSRHQIRRLGKAL